MAALFSVCIALIACGFFCGVFLALQPRAGIRLQQKFYEKINWRMEPISWEHEIRATRFMGQLLAALALAFAAAWVIKIVKF